MSLDRILLGILRTPASGYDIKQQFEKVFRHFWSADLAQIYRALAKLEKEGLLERSIEPSARGPDRKVYTRTTAGSERLREWLAEGPVFGTEKFTYLAQAFFLAEAAPEERIAFYEALQARLAEQHATLAAIEQNWRQSGGADFPANLDEADFHSYLTLDMGVQKTRALVAWADASLARIRARTRKRN